MDRMPPVEKVYEAWTSIVDGRVNFAGSPVDPAHVKGGSTLPRKGEATISSSNGGKEYRITWDGDTYASTDSATYWQGYPGYPVIAVLMLQGRLSMDLDSAKLFSGVSWKRINDSHRRDYEAALEEVFEGSGLSSDEVCHCKEQAAQVYGELEGMDLTIRRKL